MLTRSTPFNITVTAEEDFHTDAEWCCGTHHVCILNATRRSTCVLLPLKVNLKLAHLIYWLQPPDLVVL